MKVKFGIRLPDPPNTPAFEKVTGAKVRVVMNEGTTKEYLLDDTQLQLAGNVFRHGDFTVEEGTKVTVSFVYISDLGESERPSILSQVMELPTLNPGPISFVIEAVE